MSEVPECRMCRYFIPRNGSHRGMCHRFPDTVNKEQNSFCGEYQPVALFPDGVLMKVKIPKTKTSKKKHVRKR